MLVSLALVLLIGFAFSGILTRLKLPGLLGMILTGILLGPYVLNLIDGSVLAISSDLREIALIVILLRVGLSIDIKDLKRIGKPALLMSFIPASLEILAITFSAPVLLGVSYLEALIMGSVLAAVSPAVVVPRMLKLMEEGYGQDKRVPQLVMASASIDDIYVIILFTAFIGMYQGDGFNMLKLINIPISIITGALFGVVIGAILVVAFKKIHIRDTIKVLIILSIAFLIVSFEHLITTIIPLSGLLAVIFMGGMMLYQYPVLAKRLTGKFAKIWVAAEIILFVLVGAAVDINYLNDAGLKSLLMILIALLMRMIGVYISLSTTKLNLKERLFCAIAYLPKATVQAAIGAIPLAAGVNAGNLILTIAVLSIIITAPLGAIGIDRTYKYLLVKKKAKYD
ncbi:MAG: cation:proton antiporter [Erysipelotrichaceae bacterium]|nr:cation:proton antiporter [Erysipelotrichaceae bacterium]